MTLWDSNAVNHQLSSSNVKRKKKVFGLEREDIRGSSFKNQEMWYRETCMFLIVITWGKKVRSEHGQEVRRLGFRAWCCHCLAVTLDKSTTLSWSWLLIYHKKALITFLLYQLFVQLSHKTSAPVFFPEIQGHTLLNHTSFRPEGARLRMCDGQGVKQPSVSLASVCCAMNLTAKPSLACLPPAQ